MKYVLLLFISLMLAACNDDHVIKMKDFLHNIKCDGLDQITGKNVVVTIKNKFIIIKYEGLDNDGLIIAARNCVIN